MAAGQLRDGRGRESAPLHPLQSLPAPLSGAETGPGQRRVLREAHPLHLHGVANPPLRNPVRIARTSPLVDTLGCVSSPVSRLEFQRELEVSLLRDPREAGLSSEPVAGGHAVYGAETAARPAEAEVVTRAACHQRSASCDRSLSFSFCPVSRFKPVPKMDGVSGDNFSSGGQHTPSAAEQTFIAQSQHHQQFLGKRNAKITGER